MNKKIKQLIYDIVLQIILYTIILLCMIYIFGLKGMYNRSGQYISFEGFQSGFMWSGPPFISGETFKELCDYNIDDRYPLIPYDDTLTEGDRVFMKVNDIPAFLQSPPPVKVTIVISNSDETFDDTLMERVKPYARAVYAINCSAKGAKQIPIGFRDDQYTPHKDLVDILKNPKIPKEKTTLCLVNFLVETNGGERKRALDRFSSESWATVDKSYLNYGLSKATVFTIPETIQKRLDYYKTLKMTKFVVCPPGRGVDTHRVYETLFFGGIPIIKTSFLDPMYEKLGGCWIVNDWADVTEEACNKYWSHMKKEAIRTKAIDWLN